MRAVLAVALLLAATELHACECISIPLKRRFMNASEIFVGKVTKVDRQMHWAKVDVTQWIVGGPAPAEERKFLLASCSTAPAWPGREQAAALKAAAPLPHSIAIRRRAWLWRMQRKLLAALPWR